MSEHSKFRRCKRAVLFFDQGRWLLMPASHICRSFRSEQAARAFAARREIRLVPRV